MATTTKKDLVDQITERTGHSRPIVRDVVQAFLDQIIEELRRGNRLEFRDFGVFESRTRAPRKAQNPKTLEKVSLPLRRAVRFKVGRMMRDAVNDPNAPVAQLNSIAPKRRVAKPAAAPSPSASPAEIVETKPTARAGKAEPLRAAPQ